MFNKLSFKIGLLFFIFILVIETFMFYILYTNLANDRIDEVMDSLLARGNTHRDVLEDQYDPSTLEHVGIMESASEFSVVITDNNNDIIISSNEVDDNMKRIMEHTHTDTIPQDGKVIADQWNNDSYIATDSPITVNGEHKGHVFMFASTHYVKKSVNQLNKQFLTMGLIIIFFTVVTIFILSRFIAQPLIKMKEATEQLSKGRHHVTLNIDRKDELGELAHSITTLSKELEQLKNERNEFLANISHELRTPITYIKGYADIINRGEISKKDIIEYTHIIQEETIHLTHLINNLFELAKIDQNNYIIHREQVNLNTFLTHLINRLQAAFNKRNIIIHIQCPNLLYVCIDPIRFQQVIVNILDNAQKHSSEKSEIFITVKETGNHVVITVTDYGEGIPEHDLPYIFDRLYRVDKSRSRQSGGTGLGLAITKEIVEAHYGSIEITSKLDEGTQVIIKLLRSDIDE